MVINFNPKYIPGDIVYNHKKEIIRITSSYLKGTKLFYYRDGDYGWIREEAIKPIPLTPEILEKNGWKKEMYHNWYYFLLERTLLYIIEGIDGAWSVHVGLNMSNIASISFVHQLQHLSSALELITKWRCRYGSSKNN